MFCTFYLDIICLTSKSNTALLLLFNQILPFLMILEGSLFIYLFFSLKTHQIVNKAQLPSLVIRTFIHLQGNSFGL